MGDRELAFFIAGVLATAGGAVAILFNHVTWYTLTMQTVGLVILGWIAVRLLTNNRNGNE